LKTKPRYRQRDLFNEPKVNTTPLRKWRQPKIDRTDETWIYSFLDPHNLGVTVTIPAWMQGGQSR
jgi:hypothetical protein